MVAGVADVYSSVNLSVGAGRFAQAWNGTALAAAIAAMSSGAWLEYTGTNINQMSTDGPDGASVGVMEAAPNYPILDWVGKFWFDANLGRMGFVATSQGYASDSPAGQHAKYVSFNAVTNAWEWKWNPVGSNVGHLYDSNVSRADKLRKVYRHNYYDFSIDALDLSNLAAGWTGDSGLELPGSADWYPSIEVLPGYGSKGGLFVCGSTAYVFDVATKARTSVSVPGVGGYAVAHYVPGLQAIVFGGTTSGSGRWWKIDSSLVVSEFSMSAPPSGADISSDSTGCAVVGDPAGQPRSWFVSAADGHLYAIDWITGTYVDHGAAPVSASYSAATPIDASGAILWVVNGGEVSGATTCKMMLYKV